MKRTKQCPKCESVRIGYLEEQLDADDRVEHADRSHPDRIRAVHGFTPRFAGVHSVPVWGNTPSYRPLVGALEAYVCTDCGYFETFVKEPRTVAWEQLVGFSWVNPPPPEGGPFR